jgi:fermentation-respiration switch protein FrsA (DUF1100 family)
VVADSPFADVRDRLVNETARKTPIPKVLVPVFLPPAGLFASALYDIDLDDLRPERDIKRLTYPVLIIHGEADERVPIAEGRRVFDAAPEGSEFWSIPEVTHGQGFPAHPDEYVQRVESYLLRRFN